MKAEIVKCGDYYWVRVAVKDIGYVRMKIVTLSEADEKILFMVCDKEEEEPRTERY